MSIQSTDDNSTSLNEEAAEAALMASLGAAEDPNVEDGAEGEDLDTDEDDQDQGDDAEDQEDAEGDESDDKDGEDEEAPAATVSDETEIEVTVNGEAQKFTIGGLKRLAGQEASLTQKSQEAELVGGRAAAALQAALTIAGEDLAPYQDVDWMVLQQQMDPEEFAWHRENAQKLNGRYQKLVNEAQGFEQTMTERRTADNRRSAQACVEELKSDIPGWDDKVYNDIMSFGIKEGLAESDVAAITNPKVIKLLRKAMLYDKGQQVATEKVRQAPTKVLKGAGPSATATNALSVKKAEQRLAKSGSTDDAVALLMGRWR